MITIDAVCRLVGGLEAAELEHWIEEHWVLPESAGGVWVFHEVDIARVRLIVEMKRDLAIDEGALPVVLHVLDQLYAVRRRLKALSAAIETLPPDLRNAVAARLERGE